MLPEFLASTFGCSMFLAVGSVDPSHLDRPLAAFLSVVFSLPYSFGHALNWMTASPDKIVELRELDNQPVPVVLVERTLVEIRVDESLFH